MSDYYFECGELEFPKGKASEWLARVLEETDRDEADRRTVAELFETLEGDVETRVTGDRVVVRSVLIDGAYYQDQDALTLALDAAAQAGATGAWYSGSHDSGDRSSFDRGKRKVSDVDAQEVWAWIMEAGAMAEQNAKTPAKAPAKTPKPRAKAKAPSKPKPKPKAAAKPKGKAKAKAPAPAKKRAKTKR